MKEIELLNWKMLGFRDVLGRFAVASEATKFASMEIATKAGQLAVRILKKNAPIGTHYIISGVGSSATVRKTRPATLKKSIKAKFVQTSGGTEVHILCAPHAVFVINPTKAHPIVAKKAKALRFYWPGAPAQVVVSQGGNIVHFKQIMHPGSAGNPFHERSAIEWEPQMRQLLNKGASRVLESFA